MNEAEYYSKDPESLTVTCRLCPQICRIRDGQRGLCAVRENHGGELISLVYGQIAAANLDPVEKKPLFHFYPGSSAYSIATLGCNLSCPFCQNHSLSLACRASKEVYGYKATPYQIVEQAVETKAKSVCFTYSEPTIYFEYMRDIAKEAREQGVSTVLVSNGFIQPEPLKELIPLIDGANIDLKAFREETYRKVLRGQLRPVLAAINQLKEAGVWIEVTTLVIPGLNDSDEELSDIAAFLAQTGTEIPWHVSRFNPTYHMLDRPSTPVRTIFRAIEIGKEKGLKYVYGKHPRKSFESTYCPECKKMVIERTGFTVTAVRLGPGGKCLSCGNRIEGRFEE